MPRGLTQTGWRAEVVSDFFGDGSRFGVRIEYATQVVQDGTGKVVELAREFVGRDPFILSYGDILVAPENYLRIRAALTGTEAVVSVRFFGSMKAWRTPRYQYSFRSGG